MRSSIAKKIIIAASSIGLVLSGAVTPSQGASSEVSWHLDVLDDSRFVQDKRFFPKFGRSLGGDLVSLENLQSQSPTVVYIVDSGVNSYHYNLSGIELESVDLTADRGTIYEDVDCKNHGTAVASTILGDRGVIPAGYDVSVVSIKILACSEESGSNSSVGKALEWVWLNHDDSKRGIVNVSLSSEKVPSYGDRGTPTERAVDSLRIKGITVVAAAGNNDADACRFSPSGIENTLTVGSISYAQVNRNKSRVSPSVFSNYGDCVDLWSFGEGIEMPDNDGAIRKWNGTSIAAPIVSGMIIRYALQYNTSILTAEETLFSNLRKYKKGNKYGEIAVPFFKKPKKIEEAKFTKELEGYIAYFGPSELAVQLNQFVDIKKLRFEYYENGNLLNKIIRIKYPDAYYPDTISVELSSAAITPSIKMFDTSGDEEVYLGEIEVLTIKE